MRVRVSKRWRVYTSQRRVSRLLPPPRIELLQGDGFTPIKGNKLPNPVITRVAENFETRTGLEALIAAFCRLVLL